MISAIKSKKLKLDFMGKETGIMLVFLGLVLVVFLLTDVFKYNNMSGQWIFLTSSNALNVLVQISVNAIIAFGMTYAIITNGIDLSVGSQVALYGVIGAMLLEKGINPLLIIVIVLIVGGVVGSGNGIIIAKIKIPPFVMTMASMTILRGVSMLLVAGKPITIMDKTFRAIGNAKLFGILPFPIIILIVFLAIYYLLLAKTKFGRYVYIIGGNEETAILSGINVAKIKIMVYMFIGMACAMSGVILAGRLGSGQPNIGEGYELDAIAATIVGGTSFSGGIGTIKGTLIGCLIIGVINNGMNLIGVSAYLQFVMKGLIILTAVILETRKRAKG